MRGGKITAKAVDVGSRVPDYILPPRAPTVLAYGVGVDSTALLVELVAQGKVPDLVLTADTGVEKPSTYEYLDVIRPWMAARGIRHEIVRYQPKRFKHWPPYYSLLEMCLTNATLPSKSLGGSSCSLKYKKAPQDAFLKTWKPAQEAWARGQRVIRLIGYDAGPRDTLRANHALSIDDPLYECQYPLREWGWDRDACIRRIEDEGLPVPDKSACWLCISNRAQEIRELPAWCLRLIVLVEARAAPRLRTVEGLWRKTTKARPGRMTDFIRHEGLLPAEDIDRIITEAPLDLIRFQDVAASIPVDDRPTMRSWIERFNAAVPASQRPRLAA
ncbi:MULTISPECIES: hypothetical protein [Sphingomonadaceae]|uniref:hypothetical protein n=1 Tax=Sphingomonadaceae TaxID=41297 RepID=UPI001156D827|nr:MULTISPECIES: hypothetical protein [Sphingomonadaceae]QDK35879.1 hypothetical protein DM450_24485 [Sphingomonas sp. IC081]GFE77372.1 hypothetical protein NTCA1_50210 [Novosphingobium sp. TCA1]